MNKVIIICFLLLAMLTGCRGEDDLRAYFYDNQYRFEALVKASLSNKGSEESVRLKEQLGICGIWLEKSDCGVKDDYSQVRLQMSNDVYDKGELWSCDYYYIYDMCPADSFYATSSNMVSGWLTPHWSYFVDKGL